jgi:hypothetical protein
MQRRESNCIHVKQCETFTNLSPISSLITGRLVSGTVSSTSVHSSNEDTWIFAPGNSLCKSAKSCSTSSGDCGGPARSERRQHQHRHRHRHRTESHSYLQYHHATRAPSQHSSQEQMCNRADEGGSLCPRIHPGDTSSACQWWTADHAM